MQKSQVIFLSFLLAAGIMVGMSLGLAANITTIQTLTEPASKDPIVAPTKDPSHAMASDQNSSLLGNSVPLSIEVNSERLTLKEQEVISAMLERINGQSFDSVIHQNGTVNTDALEQMVEAAKLQRAQEHVAARP